MGFIKPQWIRWKNIHDDIADNNSLRPEQNGWHFSDNIFDVKIGIFVENYRLLILWISPKFVPEG